MQRRDVQRRRLRLHRAHLSMKRLACALAMVLTFAPSARADAPADKQRAREAYERGTAAYKRGDFAGAAAAYAEADAIAPSDTALQAGLDAAVKADDPVRGAELLERAHTRAVTGALAISAGNAEAKLAHRAGRVRLRCDAVGCSGTLDGAGLRDGEARWVTVGSHAVTIEALGRTTATSIAVKPDETVEVAPPKEALPAPAVVPPPPARVVTPPPAEVAKPKGVAPAAFISLLVTGVAAGALGAGVLSLAKSRHDDFVGQGCPSVGSLDCSSRATAGQGIMVLGEVLVGVSAVALVSAAIVGIGFTRWKSAPSVGVNPQGAWVGWRGEF